MNDALEFIRGYVKKQKRLVESVVSQIDESTDEFGLEDTVPEFVTVDGSGWSIIAHGLGLLFVNKQSGEAVDVHVGVLDASDAFDAWRLQEYCESIGWEEIDVNRWPSILGSLLVAGSIKRHEHRPNLYVLA